MTTAMAKDAGSSNSKGLIKLCVWIACWLISAIFLERAHSILPTERQCLDAWSSWSPAADIVEYHWETFKNDFSDKLPMFEHPSAELEAAWVALEGHDFRVLDFQLGHTGHDAAGRWQLATHNLSSSTSGRLEVFQQLRCLNLIRRHTWRTEYDYSGVWEFQGSEEDIMLRLDGCIQRLRQAIECVGDTTPYLILLSPSGKESPDFDTLHQCRNFDDILTWSITNRAEHAQNG